MKDKDVIEVNSGNKLIAEFMGATTRVSDKYGLLFKFPDLMGEFGEKAMPILYHSSWDWLMPVVEKIENINNGNSYLYSFNMGRDFCTIETNDFDTETITTASVSGSKIMSIWQSIVQFIQWYNQTKQQQ